MLAGMSRDAGNPADPALDRPTDREYRREARGVSSMTTADAARPMPWLRLALLGMIAAAIWLAFSLFSSTHSASAEETLPDAAADAAVAAVSGDQGEPAATAAAATEPVAEPPAPAEATTPAAAVAAEPAAAAPAAPGRDAGFVPPGQAKEKAVPPGQATTEKAVPPGQATEKAVPPGQATTEKPVPPGQATEKAVPPGQAGKPADRTAPASQNANANANSNQSANANENSTTNNAQHTVPPGLADKPADHPALVNAADVAASADLQPAEPAALGSALAAIGATLVGPTSDAVAGVGAGVDAPSWADPDGNAAGDTSTPDAPAGAILPVDGTPNGPAASGSPGAGGGAGTGGSGAGAGAAGASGTSDAALTAFGLDALASLVLGSVDDELPSSPVFGTDTTPD